MPRVADEWLSRILRVLYQNRTVIRADLLQATRLNPASVSHALTLLLRSAVILKVGQLESNGGRRREVLKLNAEAGYFVAVDLEGTRIRFALTNFVGDIRYRWEEDIDFGKKLEVSKVLRGIERVLGNLSARERFEVLAIGISHPGVIKDGLITAVNLGWFGFSLVSQLQDVIEIPIFTEQYHRTCILAERWLGSAQGKENCVYVMMDLGVGAGAIVHGRTLEGHNGLGAELGHITIDLDAKDRCNCGKTGCLEAIASSPNIVRQYLEKQKDVRDRQVLRVGEVFDQARKGDSAAIEVLNRAGKYLGLALSHVANMLDPELIILGGDLIEGQDVLLPRIQEEYSRHLLPATAEHPKIVTSTLGLDIGLKGAASMAFHRALTESKLLHRMCAPNLQIANPT